jgi:hypothetical protein
MASYLRRSVLPALAAGVLLAVQMTATPAFAGDGPAGFMWGSDSNGPYPNGGVSTCPSSTTPWLEPNVSRSGCGDYGGYYGEVGGYWSVLGCSASNAFNGTAATRANNNEATVGSGLGANGYFFGGGPGMDPNYDGTTSEANAWGKRQAVKASSLASAIATVAAGNGILFLDVEDDYPNSSPTGWNELLNPGSCSSVKSASGCCSTALDRATINGFLDYIQSTSPFWEAVYSTNGEWSKILGTGSDASLTATMQITGDYGAYNCVNPGPYGWTQGSNTCTHSTTNSPTFFGGVSSGSNCALGWQWSSTGGDYDQFDLNRQYLCK